MFLSIIRDIITDHIFETLFNLTARHTVFFL